MTNLQAILMLARQLVPAAIEMKKLLERDPNEEVTDEEWQRLRTINDRPFEYYDGPRPGEGE